jgi:hypothetical protein
MLNRETPLDGKSAKYDAVAHAVLNIVHVQGVPAVTHAAVSRQAKVSRAWLYKYVGGSREDLVRHAARHLGQLFTDHGPAQTHLDREGWFAELRNRFVRLVDLSERYPNVPRVYFRYRGTQNTLGVLLERVAEANRMREKEELVKIFGIDPDTAEKTSEVLSALRMSLAHSVAPIPLPAGAVRRTLRDTPKEELAWLFDRLLRATVSGLAQASAGLMTSTEGTAQRLVADLLSANSSR